MASGVSEEIAWAAATEAAAEPSGPARPEARAPRPPRRERGRVEISAVVRAAPNRELGFGGVVADDASCATAAPAAVVGDANHVPCPLSRDRPRQPRGRPRMQQLLRQRQQLPPSLLHGVPLALLGRRPDDPGAVRPGVRPVLCSGLRAGVRSVLRLGLRRERRDDDVALVLAGRGRAGHVQLRRRGRPAPPAPPVMRRSCRPSVGQAARRVPAPDSSGSSPGGRSRHRRPL